MDYILLDTCIVLHILRGKDYSERSKEAIHNFSHAPAFVMSVITAGELEAMKVFQDWGDKRINALKSFLEGVTFIDITHSDEELLAAYARIDAYSKQKVPDRNGHLMPGSGVSNKLCHWFIWLENRLPNVSRSSRRTLAQL